MVFLDGTLEHSLLDEPSPRYWTILPFWHQPPGRNAVFNSPSEDGTVCAPLARGNDFLNKQHGFRINSAVLTNVQSESR